MFIPTLYNPFPSPTQPYYGQPNPFVGNIDAAGKLQDARLINLYTGDYELDEYGNYIGMNSVDQSVLLCLFTTFGSASCPFGNELFKIDMIDQNITAQCQQYIELALAYQIQNNQIQLIRVNVLKDTFAQVQITLWYKNLITSQTMKSNIPLGVS